jgi:beta-lactamase regulating signal transducer with metallopeptidase domain
MITLLWWFGQNTITIAVLVLFVAAACGVFRYRPAAQHVLWLVVLLKFLTPPIITWPWTAQQAGQSLWSLVTWKSGWVGISHYDALELPFDSNRDAIGEDGQSGDLRPRLVALTSGFVAHEIRAAATGRQRVDIPRVALGLLLAIWLGGGAICAARQLRRITGHALLVRRATTAPAQLTHEVGAIASQLRLQPPQALVARGIVSPFVWFLGRLSLVWPETMASGDDILRSRGVIAHELAHVRRGDHWVAWLELLAGVVWWWNPLFWFVRRRLRTSAEMACDAIALGLCPENRRAYAELLLELSAGPKTAVLAPLLGVGASTPSSFERRLSMILSDRVAGNVSVWGLVTAGFLAVTALPGWSWAQELPDQDGASSGVVEPARATVVQAPVAALSEDPQRTAPASDPNASQTGTINARLDKLEAQIRVLSQLLEQSRRAGSGYPPYASGQPSATAPSNDEGRRSLRRNGPGPIERGGASRRAAPADPNSANIVGLRGTQIQGPTGLGVPAPADPNSANIVGLRGTQVTSPTTAPAAPVPADPNSANTVELLGNQITGPTAPGVPAPANASCANTAGLPGNQITGTGPAARNMPLGLSPRTEPAGVPLVRTLEARLDRTLEARLEALENAVENLRKQLQAVVPTP